MEQSKTLETLLSIEDVKKALCHDKDGMIDKFQSLTNFQTIFLNDAEIADKYRYNALTTGYEALGADRQWRAMEDTDLNWLHRYIERAYTLRNDKDCDSEFFEEFKKYRAVNPVKDYLDALHGAWDGTHRVIDLLPTYLGVKREDYTTENLHLFMQGAIRRIYRPGEKIDIMLCLLGEGGVGKSTLLRFLATNDDWYTDEMGYIDDKDVYQHLAGHWIVEIPERINFHRSEHVRDFISRQGDSYRFIYNKFLCQHPRQVMIAGTANRMDSLIPSDPTGNRRFIPLEVSKLNAKKHLLDNEKEAREFIKMCWAEEYAFYEKNPSFPLKISNETAIRIRNITQVDPDIGVIQEFLNNYNENFICTKIIWKEALGNKFENIEKKESIRINDILNNSIEGWMPVDSITHQHRFNGGIGVQRAWEKIEKLSKSEDIEIGNVVDFKQATLSDLSGMPFK